jgi:hypothetical protein
MDQNPLTAESFFSIFKKPEVPVLRSEDLPMKMYPEQSDSHPLYRIH